MAQGPVKAKPKSNSGPGGASRGGHSGVTKKGPRNVPPKKAKLAKQAKVNKKLTGSLINDTERMLGARAGHLEMLGKSKGEKVKKEPLQKFRGKSKGKPGVDG